MNKRCGGWGWLSLVLAVAVPHVAGAHSDAAMLEELRDRYPLAEVVQAPGGALSVSGPVAVPGRGFGVKAAWAPSVGMGFLPSMCSRPNQDGAESFCLIDGAHGFGEPETRLLAFGSDLLENTEYTFRVASNGVLPADGSPLTIYLHAHEHFTTPPESPSPWVVSMFPAPHDNAALVGVLRVTNGGAKAARVAVEAYGVEGGEASVEIGPRATWRLRSDELPGLLGVSRGPAVDGRAGALNVRWLSLRLWAPGEVYVTAFQYSPREGRVAPLPVIGPSPRATHAAAFHDLHDSPRVLWAVGY